MRAAHAGSVVVINFEHRRKERTMLSTALGMLAMVPVVFAVAGYTMVFR